MKVIDRRSFQDLETYNIEKLGMDPNVLVEQAALKTIKHIDLDLRHSFAIICGVNKNGSYGLAIARNLYAEGKKVYLYIVDSLNLASEEFKYQYDIIKNLDIEVSFLETLGDLDEFPSDLNKVNTLIDAISGIEFERSFQGPTEFVIDCINKSRIYTISVDIPSGMDYDTGECNIVCVQADLVVTFLALKKGLTKTSEIYKQDIKVENIGMIKRG